MLPSFGLSEAVDALGLGDQLNEQVKDETEEARKKRMAELEQRQQLGDSGSLAVRSLFGPMEGASAGY